MVGTTVAARVGLETSVERQEAVKKAVYSVALRVVSEGGLVAVTAAQAVGTVALVATGGLAEAMAGAWHAHHNQRSRIHMSTRRSSIQVRRRRRSHRQRIHNQTCR